MASHLTAHVGRELAERRYAHNMSQQELSNKSGVPVGTIRKIESGRLNPSNYYLKKLKRVLQWNTA